MANHRVSGQLVPDAVSGHVALELGNTRAGWGGRGAAGVPRLLRRPCRLGRRRRAAVDLGGAPAARPRPGRARHWRARRGRHDRAARVVVRRRHRGAARRRGREPRPRGRGRRTRRARPRSRASWCTTTAGCCRTAAPSRDPACGCRCTVPPRLPPRCSRRATSPTRPPAPARAAAGCSSTRRTDGTGASWRSAATARRPARSPSGGGSRRGYPDRVTHEFETLAIHAGQEPDPTTGAVVPPIYQVSTYAQDGVGGLRERLRVLALGQPHARRAAGVPRGARGPGRRRGGHDARDGVRLRPRGRGHAAAHGRARPAATW